MLPFEMFLLPDDTSCETKADCYRPGMKCGIFECDCRQGQCYESNYKPKISDSGLIGSRPKMQDPDDFGEWWTNILLIFFICLLLEGGGDQFLQYYGSSLLIGGLHQFKKGGGHRFEIISGCWHFPPNFAKYMLILAGVL